MDTFFYRTALGSFWWLLLSTFLKSLHCCLSRKVTQKIFSEELLNCLDQHPRFVYILLLTIIAWRRVLRQTKKKNVGERLIWESKNKIKRDCSKVDNILSNSLILQFPILSTCSKTRNGNTARNGRTRNDKTPNICLVNLFWLISVTRRGSELMFLILILVPSKTFQMMRWVLLKIIWLTFVTIKNFFDT